VLAEVIGDPPRQVDVLRVASVELPVSVGSPPVIITSDSPSGARDR
jgi:hypothetical protein